MAERNTVPERSQIPQEHTWDTTHMFASDEVWQAEYDKTLHLLPQLEAYKGRLGQDAATLLAFTELYTEVNTALSQLYNYAQRKYDQDTRVPEYQAMSSKAFSLLSQASSATAFSTPELLGISDETLEGFYAQEPRLEVYRLMFTRQRDKRAHILSDREEQLLAAASQVCNVPTEVFSKLSNADLTFPDALDGEGRPHPMSNGAYIPLLESSDRALRQSAFQTMYQTYGGMKNTLAASLSGQMQKLKFFAQARNYPNTLSAALSSTRVPESVYHTLIDTVNANLDKLHRYMKLRKQVLGLDEMHMYDLAVPMVADADQVIPYEQAKETVYQALAPLGEGYRAILKEAFDNRWIDVYENVGKRSGAYSSGFCLPHPYVLLNHKDTLDSMFTLAHEMGHALHSYLSTQGQHPAYRSYVIFVAEVASTCNEALLMEYLLANTTDKASRIYLINHFLDQFKGTLYRQTQFAEFELRMNQLTAQGEPLTADVLSREYKALNEKYYGPDVVCDPEIALEWSRIPHFYYNYYVYQYATGYSAAIALSQRILTEGEQAVKDYLAFLSGGCSKDPIDLLKGAGVDMTSAQPIQNALNLFDTLLDEMEHLLAE